MVMFEVHITVCMALLVLYFVSQCIHVWSHPYISYISFLKSFYGDYSTDGDYMLPGDKIAM